MKKIVLSLAGVMAAVAFAPEASAIPAFARQTGMACSACHAQHFPVLNGFGRAFKADGFTMMGAQEKIEGEHMSVPATLNAAVLLKVRYQQANGTDPVGTVAGTTKNDGQWQFPDEYSLFFGGRVADNGDVKVGMMMENNLTAAGAFAAGLRVPVVIDTDAAKFSVIPFTTDNLGPFYGYTESSNGVNRAIRWSEHRTEVYAYQYIGMGEGLDLGNTGLAFVAKNDMGYINFTRWAPSFAKAIQMSSTALSIAATPNIAGWDSVISVDILTGNSFLNDATFTEVQTKSTGINAQAQGELAGMETSLYASYASAAGSAATGPQNLYNVGTGSRSAMNAGADFTVIPHTLSLGANMLKTTGGIGDAVTFMAVYDLAQNVAVVANFTKFSKNQGVTKGDTLFTGMLEAAW
ncbi:MAG: hypothetical protein PHY50_01265 [Sideroxydans sp.]|nr:hypothetical protein [Sideroxydans sp.]